MNGIFIRVLNMSISACWIVLAVMAARLLLKKAPKWLVCLMWALVALRLVIPFSIPSPLSLIPSAETVPADIEFSQLPAIDSGFEYVDGVVNPVMAGSLAPDPSGSVNPMQIVMSAAASVWIAGIAVMLIAAAVSYIKIRVRVRASVPAGNGTYVSDDIPSPFILGILRPRIYLPSSLGGRSAGFVIEHERAHLKRLDHLWKPAGYIILSVYWFNPLCWIAYALLCRDIEAACDEKVIRSAGREYAADYSRTLLECSIPGRAVAACPLAFGETGVKQRVKNVLNYRKPAFWIVLAAVLVCAAIAVFFLTDPARGVIRGTSMTPELRSSMRAVLAEKARGLSGLNAGSGDFSVARTDKGTRKAVLASDTRGVLYSVGDGSFLFDAFDYTVLKVRSTGGDATVYADVWYGSYRIRNGSEPELESACHVPAAVTFDTSSAPDDVYPVKEYWEPRDGSYYTGDIRAKFPRSTWKKVFGSAGDNGLEAACLSTARGIAGLAAMPADELKVREKYPQYFGLSTSKGLELYVCAFAPGSYSCALFPGTDREKTFSELMEAKLTGVPEMRVILRSYDIPQEEIFVIPFQHVLSSYLMQAENINQSDLRAMFFAEDWDPQTLRVTWDIAKLKEKYPEYFGLPTGKGLEVYVTQYDPYSYLCVLMEGTNRNKTVEEIMELRQISVIEMREIIASYGIPSYDVFVMPFTDPRSTYEYTIDAEYTAKLRELFFPICRKYS